MNKLYCPFCYRELTNGFCVGCEYEIVGDEFNRSPLNSEERKKKYLMRCRYELRRRIEMEFRDNTEYTEERREGALKVLADIVHQNSTLRVI